MMLFSMYLALTRPTNCTSELKEALPEGYSFKQAIPKFEKHKERDIIIISEES